MRIVTRCSFSSLAGLFPWSSHRQSRHRAQFFESCLDSFHGSCPFDIRRSHHQAQFWVVMDLSRKLCLLAMLITGTVRNVGVGGRFRIRLVNIQHLLLELKRVGQMRLYSFKSSRTLLGTEIIVDAMFGAIFHLSPSHRRSVVSLTGVGYRYRLHSLIHLPPLLNLLAPFYLTFPLTTTSGSCQYPVPFEPAVGICISPSHPIIPSNSS
jgi:hypothetical protein